MGPMPFNPQQMLQQMQQQMQRNPNMFQGNPQAQQYMQVIMNGDAQRGEELALNLCQSYEVSPEEAVQQAQQFFQKNRRNIFGGG